MSRNADILNELLELNSCLAAMPVQMPYAVPEGYFAGLTTSISDQDGLVLSGIPKELPFGIEVGYFESLAENLAATAINPILETGIQAPFIAPPDYFQSLPDTLLASVKEETHPIKKSKTIAVMPMWRRIGRMAAAAILVLGIGFGSYRYLHPASPEQIASRQLSRLDGGVIDTYVEQHVDDFDDETLEAVVASSHAELPVSISSLDAAEIQEYLQENGEIALPRAGDKTL